MVLLAGVFFVGQTQKCTAADTSVANFEQVEQSAASSYSYTPMETIPGFGAPTDFPSYIVAVYKFGLWTIGISALLMITLGGYIYLTSAGNASQVGKAKGIITDAIIGLIMAITSWLLLYTINPDLVQIPALSSSSSSSSSSSQDSTGKTGDTTTPTTPSSNPVSTSDCSEINDAVNNNSSGIDPTLLKTVMAGGEGCNKSLSSDGYGSCGYSQALPSIRTACGITGTAEESCAKIQADTQLDANCAAWLIKEQGSSCGTTDVVSVGCCYNGGPSNSDCHKNPGYADKLKNYKST